MKYVFPFHLFERGDRIAIYGEREICESFAGQIDMVGYVSLVATETKDPARLEGILWDRILLAYEEKEEAERIKEQFVAHGIAPSLVRWEAPCLWNQFLTFVVLPMLDASRMTGENFRWDFHATTDFSSPDKKHIPRILLDVSRTYQEDAKTGIQRVVRGIAKAARQSSYPVEIVYRTLEDPSFYRADKLLDDEERRTRVEPMPGDILVIMDLWPEMAIRYQRKQEELIRQGVRIYYFVYDLIALTMPQYCSGHMRDTFGKWFSVAIQSCGVICDSKTVMLDVQKRLEGTRLYRRPFSLGYIHLGSDMEGTVPTKGIPTEGHSLLRKMGIRRSFLMVGTIEPRKGHRLILDAMEELWQAGLDWNLVIVGKQGWSMDDFALRLSKHPEKETRLFALGHISDEYLERIYAKADCLIAASEAEGFGLPLVEAAHHGVPVLARDIPVFREVGGEYAMYFDGSSLESAKEGIRAYVQACLSGTIPNPRKMEQLTWKESAAWLMDILLHDKWETILK